MSNVIVNDFPAATPNVVLANPYVRKGLNVALGIAALVLPIATLIDSFNENLDWSAFTDPANAIALFLAGALATVVTAPNINTGQSVNVQAVTGEAEGLH